MMNRHSPIPALNRVLSAAFCDQAAMEKRLPIVWEDCEVSTAGRSLRYITNGMGCICQKGAKVC